MTELTAALELIGRGAEEIIKREDLEARLKLGRPLRDQGRVSIRPRRICISATPCC